jgi:hypothetical protein
MIFRVNDWFQHILVGKCVEFLYQEYPNRWIGRGGLRHWPPRSPDINPLDFFLWGYVKMLSTENPLTRRRSSEIESKTHLLQLPHK